VILNGGLKTIAQVREWLPRFDGVMLGRQAYSEPYLLAQLHGEFIDKEWLPPARHEIVERYAEYVGRMLTEGHRLPSLLRHLHGLYAGHQGARAWRRFLGEQGVRPDAGVEVLRASLRLFQQAA